MSLRPYLLASALLAAGCAGTFHDPGSRVAFQAGVRQLDEDDWEPLENQTLIGVEGVVLDRDTGLGGELGFDYSWDDDDAIAFGLPFEFEGEVWTLYGGLRQTFFVGERLQPYVAFGAALARAEIEASTGGASASDDDTTVGLYVRGGADVFVTDTFFLGVDLRYLLGTEVEFEGVEGDVDGLVLAGRLGWSF